MCSIILVQRKRGENMDRKLNATEVAVLVGCSVQTLNYWYAFKRENENSENVEIRNLVNILPEYTQEGNRQTRYWTEDDIYRIVAFKNAIPKGRNGLLGSVTQRYYHKKKEGD